MNPFGSHISVPESPQPAGARPLVSVVLPVYNGEAFVERALRSFLAQTWRPMELLIVNDGSQDRTGEVLGPWIAKLNSDPSLRVTARYFEQENKGQPAATNRAIAEARGEFIALLDADDEWLPEHVDKNVTAMLADSEIGLSYSRSQLIRPDGSAGGIYGENAIARHAPFGIQEPPYFCVPAGVYRRVVFERCGGFDPSLRTYNDCDMAIRVSELYKIHQTCEALLRVYMRAESQSRSYGVETAESACLRVNFKALGRELVAHDREQSLASAYLMCGIMNHERFNKRRARKFFLISLALYPCWRTFEFLLKTFIPVFLLKRIRARRSK